MQIVVFKVTGEPHGLLMNNPASMKPSEPAEGKGRLKVKDVPLEGKAEADTKVYLDENGYLRFPAMAFRSSMIRAATGRKFGKVSATTIAKGSLFPAEDWVHILDSRTWKKRREYEVYTCRVVNPTTHSGHPRSRPHVKNWACRLPLEIDDEIISAPDVLVLLNHAGKTVGVGDFRPICPKGVGGPYGRFKAELEQ